MGKIVNIALKDLRITFRDPAALIMMLATPFVLTLVIAFAFGDTGSSSNTSLIKDIPVAVVNHDTGPYGARLLYVLSSPDLGGLLAPSALQDDTSARDQVDSEAATAAIIIPASLSEKLQGQAGRQTGGQAIIDIYSNPARPLGVAVVRSAVDGVLGRLVGGTVAGQVAVTQLVSSGLISHEQALASGAEIGGRAAQEASQAQPISVKSETASGENAAGNSGFDWLAYMAPSMAIMFLMFTVTTAGRSILTEREGGTLTRMLVTPTGSSQVIGGKVLGIFLVGMAQMTILVATSYGLFGVRWGSLAAVAVLTVSLVFAATGWGMLLAAYCRTPAQAGQLGAVLSLVFAMLAGNFVPRQTLPDWLRTAGYVTPNAWGLEGYSRLSAGGGLADVGVMVISLLVMGTVLFVVATLLFRRQYA